MLQHLFMNLVSIIFYTVKGRPGVILKAKWHALKGLPAQIRKRGSLQHKAGVDVTSFMAKGWLTPYWHRDD
jgi:uncharacterized membrane protein YhfC